MSSRRPIRHCIAALATAALALQTAAAAQNATGGQTAGEPAPAVLQTAWADTFKVFVQGVQLGNEEVTVLRSAEGWQILGSGRLVPPLDLTVQSADLRYTRDWSSISASVIGRNKGQPLEVDAKLSGGQATSTVVSEGATRNETNPVSPGSIALPNSFFGAWAAVGARITGLDAGATVPLYLPAQAEVPLVINSISTERIQTAARLVSGRRHLVTVRAPGRPLDVEIVTEADGRLVRLSIPSVNVQVVREDVASVAARQQKFWREGDEDVRIPAIGFSLAGTISRPANVPTGRDGKPVPLPAIVLAASSAPFDRDESAGGFPFFGQLASALADAGFLVLRYDRRGVGQSGGREESAGLADYAEDLRAAVKFLDERKDVDDKRIAVVGHGEGAWIAMLTAAREKKVAAVILLSAAGVSGDELLLEQQRAALDQAQLAESEKQARMDLQRRIHQAVLKDTGWETIPPEMRKQAETPWFASFLAFSPSETMARLRQPVLIVHGEADEQVPVSHGRRLLELAQARKKGGASELVTVPKSGHFLAADPSASERQVSPDVPAAIDRWLDRVLPARTS